MAGKKAHFVETSENVGEVDYWVPVFIDLVEHKVAEELDDISITSL
jgi:hypothetical protein